MHSVGRYPHRWFGLRQAAEDSGEHSQGMASLTTPDLSTDQYPQRGFVETQNRDPRG